LRSDECEVRRLSAPDCVDVLCSVEAAEAKGASLVILS
jgi:hypothetical protein